MRILVTGGAGYVGSACLRWLLRRGHEPVAFDNLSEGNTAAVPDADERLIVGDILDCAALTTAMRERKVEAVMHFAALASVPESIEQPEMYYRVNVLGTKNVLDAMVECCVGRLIFSSTAATYGFHAEMPLREDSPQVPEVPYGRTKLAAEWLIRDYSRAHGIGFALLRYFNASGADPDGMFGEDRRHETHLIPLTLMAATGKREKLLIYGNSFETRDGTCVRDYVHTDDLAQAHQLALEAMQPGRGEAYNVGSGTGASVLEVLLACEEVVGASIAHEIVGPRPGDPATLIASPEKLERELGWKPAFADVKDIIETAWRWHSTHPEGFVAADAGGAARA